MIITEKRERPAPPALTGVTLELTPQELHDLQVCVEVYSRVGDSRRFTDRRTIHTGNVTYHICGLNKLLLINNPATKHDPA